MKLTIGPEGDWFNGGLERVVGDENNILFWDDVYIT